MRGFFLALVFFLSSCGDIANQLTTAEVRSFQGYEFVVLGAKDKFQVTSDSVSGEVSLVFKNPLPDGKRHFTLTYQLEEQGSIQLALFTTDKLEKGIDFIFERPLSNLLKVSSLFNGTSLKTQYDLLQGIPAHQKMTSDVDIHNQGDDRHYEIGVVSAGSNNTDGGFFPSVRTERFWGLKLKKATLYGLKMDKTNNDH